MEFVGQIIIWIMMVFLLIGAAAYIFRPESPFAVEFKEGFLAMGHLIIPVGGMMAIIPVVVPLIESVIAPVYLWMHSDPGIAVSTFLPSDQGAYAMALELSGSHGQWILAYTVSLTAGAMIAFSLPVGLAMLEKKDHKFLALGAMCGFLSIPFACLLMALLLMQGGVPLREGLETSGPGTRPFDLPFGEILLNLLPLVIICVVLALLLRFFTQLTIKAFLVFGKAIIVVTTVAISLSIVEYFTGVFSLVFGGWPLAPFLADEENLFRSVEVVGSIAVMLAGAFPMVLALRMGVSKLVEKFGHRIKISENLVAGFLAGATNVLALYRIVALMSPRDKVLTIAFSVSASFALGDYLAFTANFQPNMIVAMIVGKIGGGVIAVFIAMWLALPYVKKFQKRDDEEQAHEAELASTQHVAADNN